MGWEYDQVLPITLWNKREILHRISCVSVSPDRKYIITGSSDGNLFVWACDLQCNELTPRWIVSGRGSGVSAVACSNKFFVTAHYDGVMCHMDLPSGRLLFVREDTSLIHTQAVLINEGQVLCAGYYADLVIIDAYTLQIVISLQSRVQSDWITCIRILTRDDGVHVQGLSLSGVLKTWVLRDVDKGVALECSSGPLGVKHCKSMAFDMIKKYLLLVTNKEVTVFDSGIRVIFKDDTVVDLEGGDFFDSFVVFWSKTGILYCCDLNDKIVKKVLDGRESKVSVPNNCLVKSKKEAFFICADVNGLVTVANLKVQDGLNVCIVASALASDAAKCHHGLLDKTNFVITSSVHVLNLDTFIAGCSNGSLLFFSATELLQSYFFNHPSPHFNVLSSHGKAVRCLLHPHFRQPSYPESLVVSGSDDHSVCFWDVMKQELLSRFCVHSGPVVKLLTPPIECQARVQNSICSVASDHSVAILSIRERRCVFFASQHPFPIVALYWKPYHDFLLVECFDGSVFVWELRTGILDRVLSGVSAEEVVYDCLEADDDKLFNFYTKGLMRDDIERKTLDMTGEDNLGPVHLRGILSAPGVESHVLFINITQLIFHLEAVFCLDETDQCVELYSLSKSPSSGIQKKIAGVLDAIKQEAEHLQEKLHLSFMPATSHAGPTSPIKPFTASGTHLVPMAQLAVSLLHAWDMNGQIDQLCVQELGLLRPIDALSFDLTSFQNVLSVGLYKTGRSSFEESAMVALAQALKKISFKDNSRPEPAWDAVVQCYSNANNYFNMQSLEMLAALWQNSSLTVRSAARSRLPKLLLDMNDNEKLQFALKWRKYLPHYGITKKTCSLSGVSMIIFALLSVDAGFKAEHFDNVGETAESIRCVISSSRADNTLKGIAVDVLGRGYLVWEEMLPIDEVLLSVFELCSNCRSQDLLKTSREALKSIAVRKLNPFLAFLKFLCKTAHPILEKSKSEILGVVRGLLLEFPSGLDALLSDTVEILLTCIDPVHLRSKELFSLIPGIRALNQVHHSLAAQRIAIGMPDGKVVVNDLKNHRSHVFPAHDETVAALRFSPDGKLLFTLSVAGSASLWQPSHGLFDMGLGQFRFRSMKNFASSVSDAVISQGIKVVWEDNRSISILPLQAENPLSAIITLNV